MDGYLSISTGHADANGDFQVADNDSTEEYFELFISGAHL
jgi:hypothetical protein